MIESIIALRRTTSNYPDAIKLFETGSGENVRDYVFRREWDSLDNTDRGREVLSIIAEYGKSISFEEIVTISRLDPSQVKDALDSVHEIFLNREGDSDQTLYTIGSLTSDFVMTAAKSLDHYETLRTRVRNFKNTFYSENPKLSSMQVKLARAQGRLRTGDAHPIKQLIREMDIESEPSLCEDPRFLWLRGFCRLSSGNGELSRARIDLFAALDFNFSPPEDQILHWFRMERDADSSELMTSKISTKVQESKGYSSTFKTNIKFQRACFLYTKGRNLSPTDPFKSAKLIFEAFDSHLSSYRDFVHQDSSNASKSEEYTRNTLYTLSQIYLRSSNPEELIDIVRPIIIQKNRILDPVGEPLIYYTRAILNASSHKKDLLQRRFSKCESLLKECSSKDRWSDRSLQNDFEKNFEDVRVRLKNLIKTMR